jgi:hypothetical protein
MALLWLKPMAARVVRNSEVSPALSNNMAQPIKARGVA